jgi:hypothetical protein
MLQLSDEYFQDEEFETGTTRIELDPKAYQYWSSINMDYVFYYRWYVYGDIASYVNPSLLTALTNRAADFAVNN